MKHKPSIFPPSPRETRPMCGCGLSRTFPFCDGSQMIAKTRSGALVSCGAPAQAGLSVEKA